MLPVSISFDVNDDCEYRYTHLTMRLCLDLSGLKKHTQKSRLFLPERAIKARLG